MPYIPQDRRDYIECLTIKEIAQEPQKFSVGEFNFIISKILWSYFEANRCYPVINDILGILEAVKLEFYHRKAEPFEFRKRTMHGDL